MDTHTRRAFDRDQSRSLTFSLSISLYLTSPRLTKKFIEEIKKKKKLIAEQKSPLLSWFFFFFSFRLKNPLILPKINWQRIFLLYFFRYWLVSDFEKVLIVSIIFFFKITHFSKNLVFYLQRSDTFEILIVFTST